MKLTVLICPLCVRFPWRSLRYIEDVTNERKRLRARGTREARMIAPPLQIDLEEDRDNE